MIDCQWEQDGTLAWQLMLEGDRYLGNDWRRWRYDQNMRTAAHAVVA